MSDTPIYDAMRKANRQRNKEALFFLTYGSFVPANERPTAEDYEYPFTEPNRTDLKPLARLYDSDKIDAMFQGALMFRDAKEQRHYHYTAPAFDFRF